MDVVRARAAVLGFALTTSLTGCIDLGSSETATFPTTAAKCEGTAVPNQYVIHWKNGKTTVHKNTSREALLQSVVEPNLNDIDFAEQDQIAQTLESKVSVAEFAEATEDWGQQIIEASSAWNQGVLGDGVIVAVVDSGVDRTHFQLQGRMYVNTGEIDGDGIDNDGNGLIDDVSGYDFNARSGWVDDGSGHGTHVSGVIAADHSKGDVLGVAPHAKILPLDFMDDEGRGYISDAVAAINYAVSRGAKVINASWGGTSCSKSLRKTIASLESKGVLFVSAAGNSGVNIDHYPEYPAAHGLGAQITVGWTTPNDNLHGQSNYGENLVQIVAPGSSIFSTYPTAFGGGGYKELSGTSMATPFVSATAALLWSVKPSASVKEIKGAILAGVDAGHFKVATHGRLNVRKALNALRN